MYWTAYRIWDFVISPTNLNSEWPQTLFLTKSFAIHIQICCFIFQHTFRSRFIYILSIILFPWKYQLLACHMKSICLLIKLWIYIHCVGTHLILKLCMLKLWRTLKPNHPSQICKFLEKKKSPLLQDLLVLYLFYVHNSDED